jgi:hypothetical protein
MELRGEEIPKESEQILNASHMPNTVCKVKTILIAYQHATLPHKNHMKKLSSLSFYRFVFNSIDIQMPVR